MTSSVVFGMGTVFEKDQDPSVPAATEEEFGRHAVADNNGNLNSVDNQIRGDRSLHGKGEGKIDIAGGVEIRNDNIAVVGGAGPGAAREDQNNSKYEDGQKDLITLYKSHRKLPKNLE